MSAERRIPASPKLRAARADKLIDLIVEPYHFNPRLKLIGDLKESASSVPEWMLDKPRKRRVIEDREAAEHDNVMAGLESNLEF